MGDAQPVVCRSDERPLGLALVWLVFLGVLFFASYIGALEITARRAFVPTIVFDWERAIPFAPWTIVPYWSLDLFYGLSILLCATRLELSVHIRRLLTAQLIAIPTFILFPLKLAWTAPPATGVPGLLFGALDGTVGKPYNLAPSLHVALLTIVWPFYARRVPRVALWPLQVWFALIGVSVLTTFQHHVFDAPTGALLGFFCLWLWPDVGGSPLLNAALAREPKRWRLAAYYLAGALLCAALAICLWGAGLWLLWPAVSLLFVAAAYAVFGASVFQKDAQGRMSLAARALLWPYHLGARLNAFLWTRDIPACVEIADGVRLGSLPRCGTDQPVVDLAAELPKPAMASNWRAFPTLDLVAPEPVLLVQAATAIERDRQRCGGVLVCCALGFSRSAAAVAVWLLSTGRVASIDAALARISANRPQIRLGAADRAAILEAARLMRGATT
jgi:hypothetical protein